MSRVKMLRSCMLMVTSCAWFPLLPASAQVAITPGPGACCTNHGCEEATEDNGVYCCNGVCQLEPFGGSCDTVCCSEGGQYVAKPEACCSGTQVSGQDCNGNGLDDRCELPNGDCNGNGILDGCEVDPAFRYEAGSGPLSPLESDVNLTFEVNPAPPAVDQVRLDLEAVGDLEADDELVNVFIAGCPSQCNICADCDGEMCCHVGTAFGETSSDPDCSDTVRLDSLEVGKELYNNLLAANGGALHIRFEPSSRVGPCSTITTYIAVTVSYPTAVDCNGNMVPDVCDLNNCNTSDWRDVRWCGDCDGDNLINACEDGIAEEDCDGNGTCNGEQIASCPNGVASCADCNENGLPDACDIDVNSPASGGPFFCESACASDCNDNAVPDACEIDRNSTASGGPFFCDLQDPTAGLTECDPDCNENGGPDACDILIDDGGFCDPGVSTCDTDCNADSRPDRCEIDGDSTAPGGPFYCDADCDPDCNENGFPDACDISSDDGGFCDSNVFTCDSDCNADEVPDGCELIANDCDGNTIPDECDILIADGGLCDPNIRSDCHSDCDADGSPDPCEPGWEPVGSRFIRLNMLGSFEPPPILFDDADYSVVVDIPQCAEDLFLEPAGTLSSNATFMTARGWCERYIQGATVVPDTNYCLNAVMESDDCDNTANQGDCNVELGSDCPRTFVWGDVDGDGNASFMDISCVVQVFKYGGMTDVSETCTFLGANMAPPGGPGDTRCVVDDDVNFLDIAAAVSGFKMIPYPEGCALNCPDPNSATQSTMAYSQIADVALSPASGKLLPGYSIDIEVYLSSVPELGAYQIALESVPTATATGSLALESITVDAAHPAYAFAGLSSYVADDVSRNRVANVLSDGGVDASQDVYLATFTFRASSTASGTFEISVRPEDETQFADSNIAFIGLASASGSSVTVAKKSKIGPVALD